jgi:hypothetical protein
MILWETRLDFWEYYRIGDNFNLCEFRILPSSTDKTLGTQSSMNLLLTPTSEDDTGKMKHTVLLLGLILCGQVHVILPAALEESLEDPGPTDSHDYQAVRRDVRRPAPPSPVVSTRTLQLAIAPEVMPMTSTPTLAPTMALPPTDRLPHPSQLRCTASSICPGQNLMHLDGTLCRQRCVPNDRVEIMNRAGWNCGKCPPK